MEQIIWLLYFLLMATLFTMLAEIYCVISTRRENHVYSIKAETRFGTTWIHVKCLCHLDGNTEALHTQYIVRKDRLSAWVYDEESNTYVEIPSAHGH